MKSLLQWLTGIVLLMFVCGGYSAIAAAEPTLIIDDVHIVDTRTGDIHRHQTVRVEGDRIVAISPFVAERRSNRTEGVRRIDGRGMYLMPGLGEMHGHVPPLTPFQGLPERYMDDVLFLYLAGGVTTVRGMLGYPHQLRVAEQVHSGQRQGPTLYLAGPSFSGNSIESLQQVRARVAEQAQAGWSLLKVHPGLTLEQFRVMAEEAKAHDIEFAGHVPEAVGIHHAIVLGSRTIDHLDGYMTALGGMTEPVDAESMRPLARLTRAHGVGVVPTQALWETIIGAGDVEQLMAYEELKYVPQQIREGWIRYAQNPSSAYATTETAAVHAENRQRLLRVLHEEGVEILLGTDAPQLFSVPGLSMRREIPLMQDAGMSNLAIIQSGTLAVGRYFADKDDFGVIRVGARADLLLLDNNPLQHIETLFRPQAVMAQGRWYDRAKIDARLAEIAAAYQ